MITSTTTSGLALRIGFEKSVEMIAKAGFDAWDFSISSLYRYNHTDKCFVASDNYPTDHIKLAKELKKIGLDNGIYCNQTHTPDPTVIPYCEDVFKRSIELTAEVGAKITVVHPKCRVSVEENIEFFSRIMPFAREYGVKLALENMWDWDNTKGRAFPTNCTMPVDFLEHINRVNDDYLVACVDIGHAEMMGEYTNCVELIYALGNKIKALHIHDNDKRLDSHECPLTMDIDFLPIIKALKEVGYDGDFTLECGSYFKHFGDDELSVALKNLADADRKLAQMFEEI